MLKCHVSILVLTFFGAPFGIPQSHHISLPICVCHLSFRSLPSLPGVCRVWLPPTCSALGDQPVPMCRAALVGLLRCASTRRHSFPVPALGPADPPEPAAVSTRPGEHPALRSHVPHTHAHPTRSLSLAQQWAHLTALEGLQHSALQAGP